MGLADNGTAVRKLCTPEKEHPIKKQKQKTFFNHRSVDSQGQRLFVLQNPAIIRLTQPT